MFARQLMISGLQTQRKILAGLIREIETRSELLPSEQAGFQKKASKVADNLRKLRKIKAGYAAHLD